MHLLVGAYTVSERRKVTMHVMYGYVGALPVPVAIARSSYPIPVYEFMPCPALANWTGQPAMSVPLHQSNDGLPIGVQFFGRFGDEATLFRLASQLELALPWKNRIPVDS